MTGGFLAAVGEEPACSRQAAGNYSRAAYAPQNLDRACYRCLRHQHCWHGYSYFSRFSSLLIDHRLARLVAFFYGNTRAKFRKKEQRENVLRRCGNVLSASTQRGGYNKRSTDMDTLAGGGERRSRQRRKANLQSKTGVFL